MGENKLTLEKICKLVEAGKPTCICGAILRGSGVNHYGPHDGGIEIEGYPTKQWVYVTCSKCGYDMALWKIVKEINRNLENASEEKTVSEKENEMSTWNGAIRKEVNKEYTGIKCQHPKCQTHPMLKVIYWVQGIPIGRCCIKKGKWGRLDNFF